jgi:hypothetical protein
MEPDRKSLNFTLDLTVGKFATFLFDTQIYMIHYYKQKTLNCNDENGIGERKFHMSQLATAAYIIYSPA